jgi:hypothetical protein
MENIKVAASMGDRKAKEMLKRNGKSVKVV